MDRRRYDFSRDDGFFVGARRKIAFEVFGADGVTPVDVTGWTFAWTLRTALGDTGVDLIEKSTEADPGGITIEGTFNAQANTQVVVVDLGLIPDPGGDVPGRKCPSALTRTDAGFEDVISYGDVPVLISAAG